MADASGRTIILDTNFLGRTFRANTFDRLVGRLAARGHAVVVPEVVVWEWAQHAHEALTAAQSELARARSAVDENLVEAIPELPLPSVRQLVEQIASHVNGVQSAQVATTDPGAAVAAISQQVLLVGSGRRSRDGVKTGAADALIVAAVEEQLEASEQVVVATADRGLPELLDKLQADVVVVRDQRELWAWHGLTEPPTDELISTVERFLSQELVEELAKGGRLHLFEQGVTLDASIFEDAGFQTNDVRQTNVDVESIYLLQILDLDVVEGNDAPRLVIADVGVQGEALITNWYIGGPDADLLDEAVDLPIAIRVSVTVELDQSWNPVRFDVNDRAAVESTERWD